MTKKKPLYVNRRLENADEFLEWARSQGIRKTLPADDVHVTVAFSREPVDWDAAGDDFDEIHVTRPEERTVQRLGDALVLRFESADLRQRWEAFRHVGASWDHDGYHPHVTITYGDAPDLDDIDPFRGDLVFGPERFEELDEDWKSKISEDSVPKIATDPPKSEAQRRAMFAAKSGHSTLGIPQSVGSEFAESDPGGKLPEKVGKDLSTSKWGILKRLFVEWMNEEEAEPEHETEDESEEIKKRAEGKLSEKTREEIGTVGSEKREELPDDDFLLPSEKKYPVKKDGKYDRGLLLAAARRARMQGKTELAEKADAIRRREFGQSEDAGAEDSSLALDWSGTAVLSHSCGPEQFCDPNGPLPPEFDFAYDRESARKYDEDGHLHVKDVNIAKASVNEYLGREIPDHEKLGLDPDKKYRLWRHPDELKRGAASANHKPILNDHVPIDAENHDPKCVVGSVGTDVRWEAPFVKSSLVFWPAKASREIESNKRRALSPAYRYRYDPTPGRTPEGEPYDGIMRDISFSHLAQIPEGRQGPDIVVADSVESIQWDQIENALLSMIG